MLGIFPVFTNTDALIIIIILPLSVTNMNMNIGFNMIALLTILIATILIIMKMNEEVTSRCPPPPAKASEQWGGKTMVALLDSDATSNQPTNLQPPQKATNLLKMRTPIHQAEIGCRTSEILVFVFAYGVKS